MTSLRRLLAVLLSLSCAIQMAPDVSCHSQSPANPKSSLPSSVFDSVAVQVPLEAGFQKPGDVIAAGIRHGAVGSERIDALRLSLRTLGTRLAGAIGDVQAAQSALDRAKEPQIDLAQRQAALSEIEAQLPALRTSMAHFEAKGKSSLAQGLAAEISLLEAELARIQSIPSAPAPDLSALEKQLSEAEAAQAEIEKEMESVSLQLQELEKPAAPTEPIIPESIRGAIEKTRDTTVTVVNAIREMTTAGETPTLESVQAKLGRNPNVKVWLMVQKVSFDELVAFASSPASNALLGIVIQAPVSAPAPAPHVDKPTQLTKKAPVAPPGELAAINTKFPWVSSPEAKMQIVRAPHTMYVMWRLARLGLPEDVVRKSGNWHAWTKDPEILEATIEFVQANISDSADSLQKSYGLLNTSLYGTLIPSLSILRAIHRNPEFKMSSKDLGGVRAAATKHGANIELLNEMLTLASEDMPASLEEAMALYDELQQKAGAVNLAALFEKRRSEALALVARLYDSEGDATETKPAQNEAGTSTRRGTRRQQVSGSAGRSYRTLTSIQSMFPHASPEVHYILAEIHREPGPEDKDSKSLPVSDETLRTEVENLMKLQGLGMDPPTLAIAANYRPLRYTHDDIIERAVELRAAVVGFDDYIRTNWKLMQFRITTTRPVIELLRPFFNGQGGARIPADVLENFAQMSPAAREKMTSEDVQSRITSVVDGRRSRKTTPAIDPSRQLANAVLEFQAATSWFVQAQPPKNAKDVWDVKRAKKLFGEAQQAIDRATALLNPLLDAKPNAQGRVEASQRKHEIEDLEKLIQQQVWLIDHVFQPLQASPAEKPTNAQIADVAKGIRLVFEQDLLAQSFAGRLLPVLMSAVGHIGFGSALRTELFADEAAEADQSIVAEKPASAAFFMMVGQLLKPFVRMIPVEGEVTLTVEGTEATPRAPARKLSERERYNAQLQVLGLPINQLYHSVVIRDRLQASLGKINARLRSPVQVTPPEGAPSLEDEMEEVLTEEARSELEGSRLAIQTAGHFLSHQENYRQVAHEIWAETQLVVERKDLARLLKSGA